MSTLSLFFVFIFGLVVGSFLNVVIFRTAKEESSLQGRSYCPQCFHQLAWRDLIPLFSYIYLRGMCRYCSAPISAQYPLVEIGTGVLFVLLFMRIDVFHTGSMFELIYLFLVSAMLVVIFVYDLRHYIIPDRVLLPALLVVAVWQLASLSFLPTVALQNGVHTLLAALGASGFFFSLHAFSQGRWMGFGDVKFALFMGLFLGWPHILVGLFVAFLTGAIIGISLVFFHKKGLRSEVPFGPFLIFGTFVALFLGDMLLQYIYP